MTINDFILFFAPVASAQLTPAIIKLYAQVEKQTGDMPAWADRAAIALAWTAGIALAAVVGFVLGGENEALTAREGAVFGLACGIVSPQFWGTFRRLAIRAVRARVA